MRIPDSFSLTTKPCNHAENNLRVIDNQPADGIKKEFGVCVKQISLRTRDSGMKFIEWVHMLRILGNEKVHFYDVCIHPNLTRVMNYLKEQNLIENFPFLESSGISYSEFASDEANSNEACMITDCFYRNRNLYKYIAIIDPDEVIVPMVEKDMNWHDMMETITTKEDSKSYDSYLFDVSLFPHLKKNQIEGIPKYHYLLQHKVSSIQHNP